MANKNHVIIGTAGHVDHGKTCLIKALTGTDTDRLKEEKKRGITIELGFASFGLPGGEEAGIIDVPGHEKFIKNMLAGAGGIDIAMLIVAADEGVMPQTIEHLEILSLLGIPQGVLVITKADAADEELCQLVAGDVRELTEGTFLEGAKLIITSAQTGQGIEELREELVRLSFGAAQKKVHEPFRLPVDRVFTMKGFGTVVTGTLIEGSLSLKDEAVLYPSGEPAKIRSIQVHGQETDKALPGQRVAVNLSNKKKEELFRGEILAAPDSLESTMMADVYLKVLKSASRTIKNGSRVHLYHGSRELLCKIILMDRDALEPGEGAYAQLRMEEATALKTGDRFVIRFYSPIETVGGGTVLDACPRKHRRHKAEVLRAMTVKEKGTVKERLEQWILEYSPDQLPVKKLAKNASIPWSEASNALKALEQSGIAVNIFGDLWLHRDYLDIIGKKVTGWLDVFHKEFPLKEGMSLEEMRSRMAGRTAVTNGMLDYFAEKKLIKITEGKISNYRFRVVRHTDDEVLFTQLNALYLENGFQPPSTEEVKADFTSEKRFTHVFSSMIAQKILVRLDEKHFIHKDFYEKALTGVRELGEQRGEIILGEYRDYLGISRKHAVSLLDSFDRSGITRKNGDVRYLR